MDYMWYKWMQWNRPGENISSRCRLEYRDEGTELWLDSSYTLQFRLSGFIWHIETLPWVWLRKLKQGLYINLEGWDGEGRWEGGSTGKGYMYTYGWFMLRFARKQQNSWRRKWQPTPVFLPRESQGWGSPVGCRLWGRTESDTTEAT